MPSVFCGIDPGLEGALALLLPTGPVVEDMPTILVGKKRQIALPQVVSLFEEIIRKYKTRSLDADLFVTIEQVHSMPQEGVSATFNFGYGYGAILGILEALHIPYQCVAPQRWKMNMMSGIAKDKGASRLIAGRLFPSLSEQLTRVKDHGRADALLLAEYGRRLYEGRK